jgi:hypothetical protein
LFIRAESRRISIAMRELKCATSGQGHGTLIGITIGDLWLFDLTSSPPQANPWIIGFF